jgi:hypothetical protein
LIGPINRVAPVLAISGMVGGPRKGVVQTSQEPSWLERNCRH